MLVHLIALQCSLRCLLGLSELQSVHRAGGRVLVLVCCWLLCFGGGVLHWLAWWKNFSHHVLVHLIALQCSLRCLLGLSELQSVHRADGGVGVCFLWGCFFVGSCCWGGVISSICIVLTCCWLLCLGGCVLHWLA